MSETVSKHLIQAFVPNRGTYNIELLATTPEIAVRLARGWIFNYLRDSRAYDHRATYTYIAKVA